MQHCRCHSDFRNDKNLAAAVATGLWFRIYSSFLMLHHKFGIAQIHKPSDSFSVRRTNCWPQHCVKFTLKLMFNVMDALQPHLCHRVNDHTLLESSPMSIAGVRITMFWHEILNYACISSSTTFTVFRWILIFTWSDLWCSFDETQAMELWVSLHD